MAINFLSPSMRASGGDLTISVSPLGLVELADEEFEVHGPRLNRYATSWAWYLGHHWAYRREQGEPQLTLNYIRAFSDFITNFTFGHGVGFKVPEQNSAVIPYLLQRVWEIDNQKPKTLWELGQMGSVSGDVFVKVAYEDPYVDPVGRVHEGRIRIIPVNPAHAFPEFHPHDKTRLLRFKLKYRFWGTSLEGTRQVFTYTEISTDERIEEYINDELVDARPNVLGQVPIVHIPNMPVSGSPWGTSDIYDIISINREMNEKMTEISDIINYHAHPITIIKGAKANQLERGPRKVWAGLPKDSDVYNLEMRGEALALPLQYVEHLKRAMHEITNVPETALGQVQPISNTSGVALAIQYQPLMNKHRLKVLQYSEGLKKVNELIILTAAVFEPELLKWNPSVTVAPEEDALVILDPNDPATYQTEIHWPDPLPVDKLIKLNEEQAKMALGLQSKRGALRELGEEFPNEKMDEIFEELKQDTMEQAALDMLRMQTTQAIYMATGMLPTEGGAELPSAGGEGVSTASGGASGNAAGPLPGTAVSSQIEEGIVNDLVTKAYGTKLAQRRKPGSDD